MRSHCDEQWGGLKSGGTEADDPIRVSGANRITVEQQELQLEGIVPPLVTPLVGDQLDLVGLKKLIEHVLDGGVSGLFLLGTSGEGVSLSRDVKRDVIRESLAIAAGRVPVVVVVSDTSLAEAVSLAQFAAAHQATAVSATVPFFFPLGQAVVLSWYRQLADRVPIPLLIYNFPAMTKVNIEPDTVARLMEHPNIVGIKDSTGDLDQFAQLCQLAHRRQNWRVFNGPEDKLAEAFRLGASGGISGAVNVSPELFVSLFRAVRKGDEKTARILHQEVLEFMERYYGNPISVESVIGGIKRELARRGICSGDMAPPLSYCTAPSDVRAT